jgi:hypothetical protein
MTRTARVLIVLAGFTWWAGAYAAAGQVVSGKSVVQTLPAPPPPPSPASPNPTSPSSVGDHRPAMQPASGPYSISGTVVSGSSGAPLDRAEVMLSTAGQDRTQVAEVITSETGTFRFDRLEAGKYTLEVFRRGYITSGYQEHDGFVTAIVTGQDQDSSDIRFELFPSGIIAGSVLDDAGDAVAGAQVSLYRETDDSGEIRIVNARTDTTDDTGTYEFSRLMPGAYYLAVSASPWYAFHPTPKTDAQGMPLPMDQQPHSPLDVAYPTTFYPNATDSSSAAPLTVRPGDRVEADFSLHAVPAIHIRIRIPQPNGPGHGMNIPQLSTEIFGTEQSSQPGQVFLRQASADGQRGDLIADIGGIAPGHYSLREFLPQGEIHGPGIDLTTSQSLDFTPDASSTDVSGKLAMASGQKLPAAVFASLFTGNGGVRGNNTRVRSDGSFDFHTVTPGVYELRVQANGRPLAVAQMAASGAQVQGSRITVGSDPVLLAATLVTGSVTVNGYAVSGGRGRGGVMILLVPRDANSSQELYRRDQSDSDGSFTLNRVVPGDYILVAIEDGWTLEWGHPYILVPYLAHGVPVHVPDREGTINLPDPVPIQER